MVEQNSVTVVRGVGMDACTEDNRISLYTTYNTRYLLSKHDNLFLKLLNIT